MSQGGLELGKGCRERIDLRLQPLAVSTRGSGFGSHAALFYAFSDQRHYPVNRHGRIEQKGQEAREAQPK